MKPQRINPVQGTQELFDLLAFVLDAEAVQKRLTELEAYRNEINDLIGVYGKADQIDGLWSAAAEDRTKAAAELSEARAKAKALVEEGEARVKAAAALADERARKQQEGLDKRASDLAAEQSELLKLDAHLQTREALVTQLDAKAQRALNMANQLKEEYETKLAKLRAAGVA